jgi:iron(III) transport system permease protein
MHNFDTALSHPLASGSIRNSLAYSSIAIGIDLVAGLAIGYLIVRVKVRGRGLVDALAMLPLAVPGLVMAFGYVAMTLRWPFGKDDPLEGFISVVGADPNPMLLLVIAYAVRRLPYIVRSTVAGLEQTSGELEEAALNLGASRTRAIRTVVIPLITANLIAGGLLAFSFAMLEVSDSLILAQRESDYPITKAIYVLFERLGDGPGIASAMGVWAMALLAVTLVGASVLMGRKMGAIFRV